MTFPCSTSHDNSISFSLSWAGYLTTGLTTTKTNWSPTFSPFSPSQLRLLPPCSSLYPLYFGPLTQLSSLRPLSAYFRGSSSRSRTSEESLSMPTLSKPLLPPSTSEVWRYYQSDSTGPISGLRSFGCLISVTCNKGTTIGIFWWSGIAPSTLSYKEARALSLWDKPAHSSGTT